MSVILFSFGLLCFLPFSFSLPPFPSPHLSIGWPQLMHLDALLTCYVAAKLHKVGISIQCMQLDHWYEAVYNSPLNEGMSLYASSTRRAFWYTRTAWPNSPLSIFCFRVVGKSIRNCSFCKSPWTELSLFMRSRRSSRRDEIFSLSREEEWRC